MAAKKKGSIRIELNAYDLRKLKGAPDRMKKGAFVGVEKGMKMLRGEARKFSGANKPKIRTGNLRDSIDYTVTKKGDDIIGFLGSDAIYAAIHEFGGTITARRADYLVFKTVSGWRKVSQVTIPPRPFLRPVIESHKGEFDKIVSGEITAAWKGSKLGII